MCTSSLHNIIFNTLRVVLVLWRLLHPRIYAPPYFRHAAYCWGHAIQYAHNTIIQIPNVIPIFFRPCERPSKPGTWQCSIGSPQTFTEDYPAKLRGLYALWQSWQQALPGTVSTPATTSLSAQSLSFFQLKIYSTKFWEENLLSTSSKEWLGPLIGSDGSFGFSGSRISEWVSDFCELIRPSDFGARSTTSVT